MLRNKIIPIALPLLGILLLFGLGLQLPGWLTERVGENYLGGSATVSLTEVTPYGDTVALCQKRLEQIRSNGGLEPGYYEDDYTLARTMEDWEGLSFLTYEEALDWYWGQIFAENWSGLFGGECWGVDARLFRNRDLEPTGWLINYWLEAEDSCCMTVWLDGYTGLPLCVDLYGYAGCSGAWPELFTDWLTQLFREEFSLDLDLTLQKKGAADVTEQSTFDSGTVRAHSAVTDVTEDDNAEGVSWSCKAEDCGLTVQLVGYSEDYDDNEGAMWGNYDLYFTFE